MHKINIILFITLFTHSVFGQEVVNLTLDSCRSMALRNSEKIKIASETIKKADGERLAAKSAWFPNISVSATGIYSKQEIQTELFLPTQTFDMATGELSPNIAVNPVTGQPIMGPDGNPLFNLYAYLPLDLSLYGGALAGISAQQPLYAGGKIIAGNKMAKLGTEMAQNNRKLQQADVIFETDQMYYNYLSVTEKLKLAKQYEQLLNRLVKVMEDSYETGMINRNDLLKVQVKHNNSLLQVQKAQTGLELTRMALCRVIGAALNSNIQINDSITAITTKPGLDTANPVSERIEYKLLEGQTQLAEKNVKLVRGDYLPTAGLSGGYNYFNIGLENTDNFDSHGFSMIASVKIPITTFGERKGKIAVAQADYNIKQLEMQQAQKYLQLEVEQARLNFLDAFKRLEYSEVALNQATENMKVSDDNYELGMETLVNVLEAKAEWQKAYSEKIDALTDLKIKESKYLKVTNKLISQ